MGMLRKRFLSDVRPHTTEQQQAAKVKWA